MFFFNSYFPSMLDKFYQQIVRIMLELNASLTDC